MAGEKILLIEDNHADARLTDEALKEGKIVNRLNIVADGEEAVAYVRRQGKYADAPRPDLILLDLNLPKKDGREVLREIRADPDLRRIPVVVLTTSQADTDIAIIYELGANSFITKPVKFDALVKVLKVIDEYWFHTVEIPTAKRASL